MNVLTPKGSAWWLSKSFATISILIVLNLGVVNPLFCFLHCLTTYRNAAEGSQEPPQLKYTSAGNPLTLADCAQLLTSDSLSGQKVAELRSQSAAESPSHLARLHFSAGQVKSSTPANASYEFANLAGYILLPPQLFITLLATDEDILFSLHIDPLERPPSLTAFY